MKFVELTHLADPDAGARKLVEIANAAEAVQDGRIYIESPPRCCVPTTDHGDAQSENYLGRDARLRRLRLLVYCSYFRCVILQRSAPIDGPVKSGCR
jgi:hypothetical protein